MELNWDYAYEWQEKANEKKEIYDEPKWNWDCGFKLDFDGSLLRISSRFYPPNKNSGFEIEIKHNEEQFNIHKIWHYVHELQMFYWLMTYKELQIKN